MKTKKSAPKKKVARPVVDVAPKKTVREAIVAMAQPVNLPIEVRAKQALRVTPEYEANLLDLRDKYVDIASITNKDGYKQVDSARKVLKKARTEIEARGKEARDDANKFAKAVIAEERRLIAIVQPEEDRLAEIQQQWDAEQDRIAREAQEKAEKRMEEIRARVQEIRSWPAKAIGKSAGEIRQILDRAQSFAIQLEDFEHMTELAEVYLHESRQQLTDLLNDRIKWEADQDQAAKDRAELARLRAEDEERRRAAQVAAVDSASPGEPEKLSLGIPETGTPVSDEGAPGVLVQDKGTVVVEQLVTGAVASDARVDDPIRPKDSEIISAVARAFGVRLQLAQQWLQEGQW